MAHLEKFGNNTVDNALKRSVYETLGMFSSVSEVKTLRGSVKDDGGRKKEL